MNITLNQVIRWAKKALKLWQKHQKKQQQQQQGQQGQHQQQGQGQGQGQSPYPAQAPHQQQYQSSPYPQSGHAQQQQQQQGAWNQGAQQQHGGYGGGGYGAHDGPATVRLLPALCRGVHAKEPLPTRLMRAGEKGLKARHEEIVRRVVQRWSANEANKALRQERRLTACFPLLPIIALPSLPTYPSLLSPPSTARRPRHLRIPLLAASPFLPAPPLLLALRPFSSTAHPQSRPFRPPPSFYDPSSPYSHPSHRAPRPSPAPPDDNALLPDLHIFHLLPSYLRPSYHVLLRLLGWEEQNQDMKNAQNVHYVELRNLAIREGDLMAKAFAASKQAYAAGDGGAAHDLSLEGKEHQRNKDRYNDEAAAWIYAENNRTQQQGSIDLHGLYVQEAVEYTEKAIADARNKGMPELRVIVGKGNHSPSHVAKIKPAIAQLMERERLTANLDPQNGGVLVVQLQGQGGGKQGGQFLRELEGSSQNDCVVM